MSDKQPGPPPDDYGYDASIPLKAVKIHPPSHTAIYGQSKYMVRIELSRNGSQFERDAVREFFPQGRIMGNTLELSETTIETIANGSALVSSQLAALEREAKKAEAAASELQRQRDAEAAAEDARFENLKHLATQVRFN